MGQGAYELAAMFNFFLVAVLVPARGLDRISMRAISRGIAVGYVLLFLGVIYHIVTLIPGQAPPVAAAGIFGAIAAWALYVAFGTTDVAAGNG